jgi:DNA invertase Pin-like site-specific DNA recombinase
MGRRSTPSLSSCAERGAPRFSARRRAAHRLIGGSCFGGLARGDVVIVTQIDRLARSTFDLFPIVKQILAAGGQFSSLAEPWADTATSTGPLMITVLGGLADVERDLIRTRTAGGRSRAKARGQHTGRPQNLPTCKNRGAPPSR